MKEQLKEADCKVGLKWGRLKDTELLYLTIKRNIRELMLINATNTLSSPLN
jgi:hypothetical protein